MSPFHDDETIEDLKKKWAGTYVRVDMGGGLVPVIIKDFSGAGGALVKAVHPEQGMFVVEHSSLVWDAELPPRGWFNTQGGAYFVIRHSERQWKRGLCEATATYKRPTLRWRMMLNYALGNLASPTNFVHNQSAWDRNHETFDNALSLLHKSRRLEVAVSNEVALTANPTADPRPVVWYDLSPVGLYDEDSQAIVVGNEVFHQELTDFIRRHALPCSIHIN